MYKLEAVLLLETRIELASTSCIYIQALHSPHSSILEPLNPEGGFIRQQPWLPTACRAQTDSLAWLKALCSGSWIRHQSQPPLHVLKSLCQTPSNTEAFASWAFAHVTMMCFYLSAIKSSSSHLARVHKLLPPEGFPAFLSRNDASVAFCMNNLRRSSASCGIAVIWLFHFFRIKPLRAHKVFGYGCISPSPTV